MCGCVHVSTPYQVGDRLELQKDTYIVKNGSKTYPEICVRIKTQNGEMYRALPPEVDQAHVGMQYAGNTIIGVLSKGAIFQIMQFELTWGGGYTYKTIILKDVGSGQVYDMSNTLLLEIKNAGNGTRYSLMPAVFKLLE
jgi:hypothetical protein